MWEEVKANIVNNFLNKNYRYTCVLNKGIIFKDMKDRFPFPFENNNEYTNMKVSLGDNIFININYHWEEKENGAYYLKSID